MGETYGLPVDEDEVYLGVRHPERFDDVLDRRRAVKSMSETAFAPGNGQVVVEFFVKAKLHRGHGYWASGTGVAYAVHARFTADRRSILRCIEGMESILREEEPMPRFVAAR
jgi:hypothetical protein